MLEKLGGYMIEKLGGRTIYASDKPETKEQLMRKETIIAKEKSNMIIKKEPYFHNNDANKWNNVARLNQKFYNQYHCKREVCQATHDKCVDKAIKEDREKEFQEKKFRVLSRKNKIQQSFQNQKLERLTLEKNANQKILDTNISNQIMEKIYNADFTDEKERVLKRSSTHNRISTRHLWNDRERLVEEKLKFDLTNKVLRGEKDAIDIIQKRIENDQAVESVYGEGKQQRLESIKNSFKMLKQRNFEENSVLSNQHKNSLTRAKQGYNSKEIGSMCEMTSREDKNENAENVVQKDDVNSQERSPNSRMYDTNISKRTLGNYGLRSTFLADLNFENKLKDYEGYNSDLTRSFKQNNFNQSQAERECQKYSKKQGLDQKFKIDSQKNQQLLKLVKQMEKPNLRHNIQMLDKENKRSSSKGIIQQNNTVLYGKPETSYFFVKKDKIYDGSSVNRNSNSERLDTSVLKDNTAQSKDKNFKTQLHFNSNYQSNKSKGFYNRNTNLNFTSSRSQISKKNVHDEASFSIAPDIFDFGKVPLDKEDDNNVNIYTEKNRTTNIELPKQKYIKPIIKKDMSQLDINSKSNENNASSRKIIKTQKFSLNNSSTNLVKDTSFYKKSKKNDEDSFIRATNHSDFNSMLVKEVSNNLICQKNRYAEMMTEKIDFGHFIPERQAKYFPDNISYLKTNMNSITKTSFNLDTPFMTKKHSETFYNTENRFFNDKSPSKIQKSLNRSRDSISSQKTGSFGNTGIKPSRKTVFNGADENAQRLPEYIDPEEICADDCKILNNSENMKSQIEQFEDMARLIKKTNNGIGAINGYPIVKYEQLLSQLKLNEMGKSYINEDKA